MGILGAVASQTLAQNIKQNTIYYWFTRFYSFQIGGLLCALDKRWPTLANKTLNINKLLLFYKPFYYLLKHVTHDCLMAVHQANKTGSQTWF